MHIHKPANLCHCRHVGDGTCLDILELVALEVVTVARVWVMADRVWVMDPGHHTTSRSCRRCNCRGMSRCSCSLAWCCTDRNCKHHRKRIRNRYKHPPRQRVTKEKPRNKEFSPCLQRLQRGMQALGPVL
jgi:hypothetical protein